MQTGMNPGLMGSMTASGPQNRDQVPPEVVALLERPGILEVVMIFDHGLGRRFTMYSKITETPNGEQDNDPDRKGS